MNYYSILAKVKSAESRDPLSVPDIYSIIYYMAEVKVPGYKQNPPDWCDDCNAAPGGECPDCGCTHNC